MERWLNIRKIIDEFSHIPSGHKRWKLRNPERYKRSERERKERYVNKNREGSIIKRVKARAKRAGLEFSLTKDDIIIPEICPVLGIKMVRHDKKGWAPNSPSVDRIDNSKGYTPDNIKIISWRANSLKSDATIEELEKVLDYMKKEYVPRAA